MAREELTASTPTFGAVVRTYIYRRGLTISAAARKWGLELSRLHRFCTGERTLPPAKALQVMRDLRFEGDDLLGFLNFTGLDSVFDEVSETLKEAGESSILTNRTKLVWSPKAATRAHQRQHGEEEATPKAIDQLRKTPSLLIDIEEHMARWRGQATEAAAAPPESELEKRLMIECFASDVKFHLGILNLASGQSFQVGTRAEDIANYSDAQLQVFDTIRDHYEDPPSQRRAKNFWFSYTGAEELAAFRLHEDIFLAVKEAIRTGDASPAVHAVRRHGSWLWF